jgi:hypothetical protein
MDPGLDALAPPVANVVKQTLYERCGPVWVALECPHAQADAVSEREPERE